MCQSLRLSSATLIEPTRKFGISTRIRVSQEPVIFNFDCFLPPLGVTNTLMTYPVSMVVETGIFYKIFLLISKIQHNEGC